MDARGYNILMNTFIYGYGAAFSRVLDVRLVNRQVGDALLTTQYGRDFLERLGFKIGSRKKISTIARDFASQCKKIGLTRRFEILAATEERLELDVGMCVFAAATAAFRQSGVAIPPCPVMGLLLSLIELTTDKNGVVSTYHFNPETNSSLFTVDFKPRVNRPVLTRR